jgi:chemotaxis protein MotB
MIRRRSSSEHANHERWLVSYADFITLLFAFFVVMFASTQADKNKTKAVSDSVREALEHGQFTSALSTMLGRGKHEAKKAPITKLPTEERENPPPPMRPPAIHRTSPNRWPRSSRAWRKNSTTAS